MPRPISKKHAEKQLRNLKTHAHDLHKIAKGSKHVCKDCLQNASPELVEALATTTRILDQKGYGFPKGHANRARKLMSTQTARRTKKLAVSGPPGKYSRGTKFFKTIAQELLSQFPDLVTIVE